MRRGAVLVAALAAAGCIDALDPESIVAGPRVLEVVAEPPEVRPGEVSTLSALLAGTRGVARYRWSVCPVTDLGAIGAGAAASTSDCFRDGAALVPLSTDATASFVLPEAILAQVTNAVARYGDALPGGFVETYLREVGLAVPVVVEVEVDGRTIRALKRVVVSRNPAPNRNPPRPRLKVGGRWVSVPAGATDPAVCVPEDGAPLSFAPGRGIELTPEPDEAWSEGYTVLTATGAFAHRDEQAFYSWFATGGSLGGLTRSPLRDNTWTLPVTREGNRDQSLWMIVRDGHGGSSGCRVDLRVEP